MGFSKSYLYFIVNSKGLTIEEFRQKIGIGITCWYKRMNNPDTFSFGEMSKIKEVLGLSKKEFDDIFFANNVANTQQN